MNRDTIIVSFTTWPKRVEHVYGTLNDILNGTVKPYIVLNISELEFKNGIDDLPENLKDLYTKNKSNMEINVFPDNTKVWKKFYPTLKKYPDNLVVSIDDDRTYRPFFVETLYKTSKMYNHMLPVSTVEPYSTWPEKFLIQNGKRMFPHVPKPIFSYVGSGTMSKYSMYGDKLDILYNELVVNDPLMLYSDLVYTFAIFWNGLYFLKPKVECYGIQKIRRSKDDYSGRSDVHSISRYIRCTVKDFILDHSK